MKKLLYTLLAVSIIFSACKKEDEEPTNTGNNNNGAATFLENQDGSVWYLIPPPHSEYGLLAGGSPLDTIGFYNATYFMIWKGMGDCLFINNGELNTDATISTVIHNSNTLKIQATNANGNDVLLFEFIDDGLNSLRMNLSYTEDDYGVIIEEYYYTRSSTQTNLSCN